MESENSNDLPRWNPFGYKVLLQAESDRNGDIHWPLICVKCGCKITGEVQNRRIIVTNGIRCLLIPPEPMFLNVPYCQKCYLGLDVQNSFRGSRLIKFGSELALLAFLSFQLIYFFMDDPRYYQLFGKVAIWFVLTFWFGIVLIFIGKGLERFEKRNFAKHIRVKLISRYSYRFWFKNRSVAGEFALANRKIQKVK